MNRLLLVIFGLAALQAQILVDTVAGGKIPNGVPIQDVALGLVSGATWGAGGNFVFTDSAHDIIRRVRPDGIVETIAGTGVTGYAGDGGPANSALLHGPGLPQFDAAGNLYFVDGQNCRIRRIDTRGVITTVAGDGIFYNSGMDVEGPALLRSINPSGLVVDPTGIVYFSDSRSNVIRRISRTGQLEIVAGVYDRACTADCFDGSGGPAKNAHLNRPSLIARDEAGNLYVVEAPSGSSVIRRISPNGIITKFAGFGFYPFFNGNAEDGGPALDQYFGQISGLAADSAGNVYVSNAADFAPSGVRRIDSNGIITTIENGQNGGLAADVSGKLLLFTGVKIQQVATDGTITTIAPGDPKAAPDGTLAHEAWLLSPGPIAVSSTGDLYIYELQTCVIRRVGTNGILTTIAGTGRCAATPASPTGQALPDLSFPDSMAVDSQDRLWVASGRIFYVIAPDGSITSRLQPANFGSGTVMAFDAKDRMYLMNLFSLIRVAPDGSVQSIVNQPSNSGAPVSSPGLLSGLGVDPAKNVYFSATQSIYRINDDGSYSVVYKNVSIAGVMVDATGTAWNGTYFTNALGTFSLGRLDAGYSGDGGPAQSARFQFSLSTSSHSNTVVPNGDLYFVDGERIRRFTGIQPQTPPVISAGGIVNSASYSGGFISPGELVSIFGSNFGASGLELASFENNVVPFQLGRTKVLFDDQLGEIVAMTPNLINVLAPYSLTPGTNVQVRVQVDASVSASVTMPVVATVPDLYTADESGSGPGIFLNEDGSINSSSHPAPHGTMVTMYGTGEGFLIPQLPKGALVISTPYPTMPATPTVTIAGQPAEVRYAGAAPFFPLGVFEIDVRIPPGIPVGNARVSVTMGDRSTTRIVTVAVQ